MNAAVERVAASRERLRRAMRPPVLPVPPRPEGSSWLHKVTDLPLVREVIESVAGWWSHHPLRPAVAAAGEASNAFAAPVAKRHPYAFVLVSALLGAVLAWARPWRWLYRSAMFAGFLPTLVSRAVTHLPIESWMTMLGSALASPRPRSATTMADASAPVVP